MLVAEIREILRTVHDPEIPVLDIVEMGIVREVTQDGEKVVVSITPTYSGCPAMEQIQEDLIAALKKEGIEQYEVKTVLNPPWTTDWLWHSAKEKLKEYGIAPPCHTTLTESGKEVLPTCPLCDSANVKLISAFSSTACKSMYKCLDCMEPFDHFKPY